VASRHLLKPREAAERLRLTEGQVRALIADGRLASVKVGKRSYVPNDAPDRFIAEDFRCRDEIPVRAFDTSPAANATISFGRKPDATANEALALESFEKLISRSPDSSKSTKRRTGRVIPLRS
jgi:excisionase family DNA binding protein